MRWLSSDTMVHKKKVRSSSMESALGLVGRNCGEWRGCTRDTELCTECSGGGS